MKHLYKTVNAANGHVTFTDFLEEAQEFIKEVCQCDSYDEEWPKEYSLNDIIKYSGHNRWISFKRSLAANNRFLLNLIIETDPENYRLNNIISLIFRTYSDIQNFITSRLPPEILISQRCDYAITYNKQWNRIDIALELNKVIDDIVGRVKEIDPSLIPQKVSKTTIVNQNRQQPDFGNKKLSIIFDKLMEKGYVTSAKDSKVLNWIGDKGLYGFFIDTVTTKLGMRDDSNRIPWKFFRTPIVNHDKILRTAQDRVTKYDNETLPKPNGYQEITRIIEES